MKIRTRIFLVFIIVMVVGIFSFMRWIQGEMRPRYMEAQEDTLVDTSQMLASLISTQALRFDDDSIIIDTAFLDSTFKELNKREVNAQIYQINKQQVDIRVYVTNQAGKVVFDSDADRDLNLDYSQWRDVYYTLRGEYGARSSEFDPLYPDGSIMYIGAPIKHGDEIIGVVSVGKPTRNAERFMEHLLGSILTVGLSILAVALVVGIFLNGWISRPLYRLQQYANAVISGERTTLPKLGNNEVGEVGRAMESMRIALDGKSYVSDYVQSLTHELKSPIAAIQGAAELLDEDMPVDSRQRFIGNIRSQVTRMQELVERLLDLAALEYRPELENTEWFDVEKLVNDIINGFQPMAEKRSVRLFLRAEKCPQLQADRFLIAQAITNILKNAIEFSPVGETVTVSLSAGKHRIRLNICDNGPGIPEYAQAKVFDRFFSMARPGGEKGSGLGLSFVKQIMMLHHADIQISNHSDSSGTCVQINIPLIFESSRA